MCHVVCRPSCLQAKECPVQMMQLLDILEVIVPYKHFHKLRQFVNVKLPPGFPVKLSEWEGWVLGGASVKVCLWWVILVWVHQGCPL